MVIALALIAGLALGGLLVALVLRRKPASPAVDLGAAFQDAASRAVADALPGFLRANDEARKVDVKAAEATLDKRHA